MGERATDISGGTGWSAFRPHAGLLAALWLAEITGSFEASMILAAMKYLIQDFGDPALVGRLGDLFGRRRILLIVLAIGLSGSLISAVSTSFA